MCVHKLNDTAGKLLGIVRGQEVRCENVGNDEFSALERNKCQSVCLDNSRYICLQET